MSREPRPHVSGSVVIRNATTEDEPALLQLAVEFATSFAVEETSFQAAFAELLADPAASLIVADSAGSVVGYLLGFEHLTLYANGRVAWVEEIMVRENCRRSGVGAALMRGFERWATERNCKLVALATRRAAAFYRALEYEESAVYFRKRL